MTGCFTIQINQQGKPSFFPGRFNVYNNPAYIFNNPLLQDVFLSSLVDLMSPWLVTSAKQTQGPCSQPQGAQQIPESAVAVWQQHNSIFDITILSVGCLSRFENCRNSRGWGGGGTSTCGMEIPGVWGSKAKVPSLGVFDIFWFYTICPFSTTCNPDYHNSLKSWWG